MMRPIGDNSANIDSGYRILLVLWFGFLVSVGFLIVVVLFIVGSIQARPDNVVISWALSVAGTCLALISFVAKRKLLEQAVDKQDAKLVIKGYIIAYTLSETPSIIALLLFVLTPSRAYIFLFTISAVILLAHYPRRKDLMAAMYKNR